MVRRYGVTSATDKPVTYETGPNGTYEIRNMNSGKLLAIAGNSTAVGAFAVQDADDGTADNRWRIVLN